MENVIIVDNSILFANAMSLLIENTFHKKVTANVTFDDDLLSKFKYNKADMALIAFDNKSEEQVNRIGDLMEQFPETVFVALCDKKENKHHNSIKEYGFMGFINKLNFINDFKATINSFEMVSA